MAAEDGAATARAGDYVNEVAEGRYALQSGHLIWREAAEDANVHLKVAVADAADGRFVPGLPVRVEILHDGSPLL